MVCAKCNQDFLAENKVATCSECKLQFHASCCRLRTLKKLQRMLEKDASTWKCDECAGESASVHSRSDNDDPSVLEVLKKIQQEMSESRKENIESFAKLETSLASVKESLEELKGKVAVVEAENEELKKECTALKEENKKLGDKLFNVQCDVHELQQYSRNRNIEIRGVPVSSNENVYAILETLAGVIDVPYSRQDISIAHRVPGRSPAIIVQFVSRTTRATWLTAAKVKKPKSSDLMASPSPSNVFINEHLTPHNRTVLGRARALVKDGSLAYAWSKDGKILVRKTRDTKAVQVWFIDDVYTVAAQDPAQQQPQTSQAPPS